MRVSIARSSRIELTVKALGGKFEGLRVASVEGIALCDVVFAGPKIIGTCSAVYGAVLNDDICTDAPTLFGLGINRPFSETSGNRAIFDGDRYVDADSGRAVESAKRVVIMHEAIHYA